MSSLRRAVFLSLAQRYVAFIIQFVASVVLARLLTPSETGIFSLAAAIVGIAHLLRDFGVGEYVIQEKELTRERLRSALGVTVIMAWTLAALLFALASPIASYYKEAGVAAVLHVLVINFLLLPLGTTTFAVLTKEMAFSAIFWVQTISALVSSALCVWLAWQGYSYMSMAWSSLAGIASMVIMLAIVHPGNTFMLPSFKGLGRVSRFGGLLTIGRLMDQLCRRAPDLMIGSGLGFYAVGINSKASSLLDAFQDFFSSAISRVAMPAFAKKLREHNVARDDYLRGVRLMAIVPLAFFCFLALFAAPLIFLLFGANWMATVPLLRIAGIGGILAAPYMLGPPVLTAHGQVSALLRIQLIGGITFLPMIYVASRISLIAVAIAGVLGTVIKIFFFQQGLREGFNLRLTDLLRNTAPGALITAVTALASAPALFAFHNTTASALVSLMIGGAVAITVMVAGLFVMKHPLANELRGVAHRLTPSFAKGAGRSGD